MCSEDRKVKSHNSPKQINLDPSKQCQLAYSKHCKAVRSDWLVLRPVAIFMYTFNICVRQFVRAQHAHCLHHAAARRQQCRDVVLFTMTPRTRKHVTRSMSWRGGGGAAVVEPDGLNANWSEKSPTLEPKIRTPSCEQPEFWQFKE